MSLRDLSDDELIEGAQQAAQLAEEWASVQDILAAHPTFAHRLRQFMALHDAAEVLDELKPPHGDTAAEFLREIGNHVLRETGAGEDFLQSMIASRPGID